MRESIETVERRHQERLARAAVEHKRARTRPPANHKPIIDLWPGPTSLAADLGSTLMVARGIRARGWIPDWYWWDLVKIAEQRGMRGVSLERLAKISSSRKP